MNIHHSLLSLLLLLFCQCCSCVHVEFKSCSENQNKIVLQLTQPDSFFVFKSNYILYDIEKDTYSALNDFDLAIPCPFYDGKSVVNEDVELVCEGGIATYRFEYLENIFEVVFDHSDDEVDTRYSAFFVPYEELGVHWLLFFEVVNSGSVKDVRVVNILVQNPNVRNLVDFQTHLVNDSTILHLGTYGHIYTSSCSLSKVSKSSIKSFDDVNLLAFPGGYMWFYFNSSVVLPLSSYARMDKRSNILIDEGPSKITIHPFPPYLQFNESFTLKIKGLSNYQKPSPFLTSTFIFCVTLITIITISIFEVKTYCKKRKTKTEFYNEELENSSLPFSDSSQLDI